VYYEDDEGRLRCIPLDWTNLAPPVAFLQVSAGRSQWRVDDLLKLVEQLEGMSRREGHDV